MAVSINDDGGAARVGAGLPALEKTFSVLDKVAQGPISVAKAARLTGISRGSVHRIIKALETKRFVVRDMLGRYVIGPSPAEMSAARVRDPLQHDCDTVLGELRDATGSESCIFRPDELELVCIGSSHPTAALVPVGGRLPPSVDATTQVLIAWSGAFRVSAARMNEIAAPAVLAAVRQLGFAKSAVRPGVVDLSAPVRDHRGEVVAAVTAYVRGVPVSHPAINSFAKQVQIAGSELTDALRRARHRLGHF